MPVFERFLTNDEFDVQLCIEDQQVPHPLPSDKKGDGIILGLAIRSGASVTFSRP